uniref:Uncharacterized protein n=1 Tax=Graphocephala atropunctata TaxID=36148 RepID=A0A1B6L995_9HEMI
MCEGEGEPCSTGDRDPAWRSPQTRTDDENMTEPEWRNPQTYLRLYSIPDVVISPAIKTGLTVGGWLLHAMFTDRTVVMPSTHYTLCLYLLRRFGAYSTHSTFEHTRL